MPLSGKIPLKIDFYPSEERGGADHGWLKTRHSFSFADYYNPARMSFGTLRVLNEDWIEPGQGFGMHSHENMEIVTIVLEGVLEHADSMKNHGVILPGEIQRMSAGTGITHSEFNHSKTEKVHLLQIWVHPKEKNIAPGYEQKKFSPDFFLNRLVPVVSGQGGQTVYIHQDAVFSLGQFEKDQTVSYLVKKAGNGVYIFLIQGKAQMESHVLHPSDALGITRSQSFSIQISAGSKILAIEVPV